jgi:sortase A
MRKFLATLSVLVGLGLLGVVVVPIAWAQLQFLTQPKLIDPTKISRQPLVAAAIAPTVNESVDFTDSSTWFAGTQPDTTTSSRVNYYTVSVPSVGIKEAVVEINGTDLKKNPIQYPGTAIPGQFGNTVIFGHSTLPQLYHSSDPISIFTSLPQVKKGDEIIINYDGVTYRYVINHTAEVNPSQIEVLAQRYDKNELTLITCVPLGTYLRRFVARAELVN